MHDNHDTRRRRVLLLPLLFGSGVLVAIWQPVSLLELLDWGQRVTERPAVLVVIVLAMALLFAFGLPGSLAFWMIAPFQPPLLATALLVLGSVAGASGAYWVAGHLRRDWHPGGLAGRIVELLRSRGDLFAQLALRVLPGFPHAVVNFAGGALRLPLPEFLLAAVIGLTVKWAIYAKAAHGITDSLAAGTAIGAGTLLPLVILTGLLLLGGWYRRRVARGHA
jgi:uncharacterized membrane protein YdjX (TVP38/TMEM64 family)